MVYGVVSGQVSLYHAKDWHGSRNTKAVYNVPEVAYNGTGVLCAVRKFRVVSSALSYADTEVRYKATEVP